MSMVLVLLDKMSQCIICQIVDKNRFKIVDKMRSCNLWVFLIVHFKGKSQVVHPWKQIFPKTVFGTCSCIR